MDNWFRCVGEIVWPLPRTGKVSCGMIIYVIPSPCIGLTESQATGYDCSNTFFEVRVLFVFSLALQSPNISGYFEYRYDIFISNLA